MRLAFDSDIWGNPHILKACYALGRALEERGGKVTVAYLTPEDGHKRGLDDYWDIGVIDKFLPLKHKTFKVAAEWFREKHKDEGSKVTVGQQILICEQELWHDEVEGGKLLDSIENTFKRYVKLPPHAETALALWTLMSYFYPVLDLLPILAILAETMRAGRFALSWSFLLLGLFLLLTSRLTRGVRDRVDAVGCGRMLCGSCLFPSSGVYSCPISPRAYA